MHRLLSLRDVENVNTGCEEMRISGVVPTWHEIDPTFFECECGVAFSSYSNDFGCICNVFVLRDAKKSVCIRTGNDGLLICDIMALREIIRGFASFVVNECCMTIRF